MLRHGHSQRKSAGLKTSGRIRSFFFHHHIWISPAPHHWRPSLSQRHRRYLRQHRPIPPHSRPSTFQRVAQDLCTMFLPAQPTQVISHIKRTFTLRTKCLWLLGGNSCSASRTLKMFYLWHSRTIAAHESPRQAASKQVFCALLVLGLNLRFSAMMSVLNRLFARQPLATRQLPPI